MIIDAVNPGDRVAGRFVLEKAAGEGGMGVVFLARDEATGDRVALKVLRFATRELERRFAREAALLAAIDAPSVVRHVAHGFDDGGEPFLAMEWLDGESLSTRTRRERATVDDVIALGKAVAGSLSALHRAGVVHRDIKPSNIVLRGGAYAGATLIDFGIARGGGVGHTLTGTSEVLGTPHYMSPEQTRGEPAGPGSDIYATGAVLFEMLAGHKPFEGPNELAVLAKILLEPPPELAAQRAEVPSQLAALVERCLAKEPAARPRDGAELVDALESVSDSTVGLARPKRSIGPSERRMLSVILCGTDAAPGSEAATLADGPGGALQQVRRTVERYEGRVDLLGGGSMVVSLTGAGGPSDRAQAAARCALEVQGLLGQRALALVTGRGVVASPLGRGVAASPPGYGRVIDRGVALLAEVDSGQGVVVVDPPTARLLGSGFELRSNSEGLTRLVGERRARPTASRVLGKPTPFVGREWELGTLLGLLDECVDDSVARVAVITGAPGSGKSRLCAELLAALEERGEDVEILYGRGDPMAAGAPFRMLAEAIKSSAGIADGDAPTTQRDRLRSRLSRSVAAVELDRVCEMLGEMVGVPFDEGQSERLRAARGNARIMGDAMRAALEDWLAAECRHHPVLLVLDDLQWGGISTIRYVEAALRHLTDRPLLVVGLARPEVDDTFPDLWGERHAQRLRLRPLSKRAGRGLVRSILGQDANAAVVDRVIARAEGNALFLEELLRAVAAGAEMLPDSLLGMVEARLEGLSVAERLLLRAGAVFGETFWTKGVQRLTSVGAVVDEQLARLVESEVIVQRPSSSLAGEQEFAFRNALLREASYATLTADDRQLAHRLAGGWLEEAGSSDAVILAEHYDRGAALPLALPWYRRAAQQALEGYDYEAADRRAARGLECFPDQPTEGALVLVRMEVRHVAGEYRDADRLGREAAELLEPGTAPWYQALRLAIAANGSRSAIDDAADLAERAQSVPAVDEAGRVARIVCASEVAGQYLLVGRSDEGHRLLSLARRLLEDGATLAPEASAWVSWVASHDALQDGDAGAYLQGMERAALGFDRAGDARYATSARVGIGYACTELGRHARARVVLEQAVTSAERLELPRTVAAALNNLGHALSQAGAHEDACDVERRAAELSSELGNHRYEGTSLAYLANALLALGETEAAEAQATRAVTLLENVKPSLPMALAVLARVLLRTGRPEEALDRAEEGMALLEAHGVDAGEAALRLVYADALQKTGDVDAAATAARAAIVRLNERASAITDEELRDAFLNNVPENAATLALEG